MGILKQEETARQDGGVQWSEAAATLSGGQVIGDEIGSAAHFNASPVGGSGEPPSLISPPSGCRFHPRCPHAMPVCRQQFPPRTELGGGHWVHCFLYGVENETHLTEISHASKEDE
jgi:ABC-type antimicrobial peptide transport system ATPase subunit